MFLAIVLATTAVAQSTGGSYEVNPHVVANGGGHAGGGLYAVEGTIGQHDAGRPQLGAVYEINGGFHRPAAGTADDPIFRSGFE